VRGDDRAPGYEKHDPAGRGSGNSGNGTTSKTLLIDVGAVDLAVLRDRNSSFDPKIVREGQPSKLARQAVRACAWRARSSTAASRASAWSSWA